MKKALIITTVSGFVPQFEMENVALLQALGYEVHYASNFKVAVYKYEKSIFVKNNIIEHQIDFARSPYAIAKNIRAYQQLKKLVMSIKFDLIHCHTPMGGVIARLVAMKNYTGQLIYTAHGFHFFKGAPLVNWLIYYPVEKLLSRYTDYLITINAEDYNRARKFHAKNIVYIPGVGIDCRSKINTVSDREKKLKDLNIPNNYNIVLSVGELIKRKNYDIALEAFKKAKLKNTIYLICGNGVYYDKLIKKAHKLALDEKVTFLGYRTDVYEIMNCASVFFFPSKQEGLSVALMEAMAAGLPIVCSNIRGNADLINSTNGGFMYHPRDVAGFSKALVRILSDPVLANKMGESNKKGIAKFDKSHSRKIMENIYRRISSI